MEAKMQPDINEFFIKITDRKTFAKTTRRFLLETIKLVLASEDDKFNKEWITDGHFWLNDFCELIDPQLEENN